MGAGPFRSSRAGHFLLTCGKDTGVDLRDILAVLRTRWIVTVSGALVGGLAALAISLLVPPTYQATIQFYATVSGGENMATAAYQGSLGAQQRVQSYAALVKSTEIAREVADGQDVDLSPNLVANQTEASANANTVLLDVTVRDSDPERAFRVAEGYGEVLPDVINRLETPDGGGPALAKLTVVNPPSIPSTPVSPRTEQNIILGLVLGLLVGASIALLRNALDRRIKSSRHLEEVAGAPVIGSIPFKSNGDKDPAAEHLVPFREGHSPAAEAFRRLRTNLQFLNVDNPPKVLVLTSSVAMEGKSESAVNLTLALAEAGHRVLLIEADLRRPRVVNYMNMPDKVGLTNILSGQAPFREVIQQTRHEGADLLACGPLPPNPSELIASDAAGKLIGDLRNQYDYVIIDSPPLLPVTDGALLARIADGALLVVRTGRTTSEQVEQSVDALRKANASLLGLVMVASKPARKGTAGYADNYYYSSKLLEDSD